jgi:hypothetical protein
LVLSHAIFFVTQVEGNFPKINIYRPISHTMHGETQQVMMDLFDTSLPEILASINLWKVATIVLLAMNVKCLPFVWHVGRLP